MLILLEIGQSGDFHLFESISVLITSIEETEAEEADPDLEAGHAEDIEGSKMSREDLNLIDQEIEDPDLNQDQDLDLGTEKEEEEALDTLPTGKIQDQLLSRILEKLVKTS
jgi:hypothetical protein